MPPANLNPPTLSVPALIEALGLVAHDEGGYFRQLYQSDWTVPTDREGGARYGLNTIYYLLTADSPKGHLHRNQSDIVHFFHAGSPLTYFLLSPEGQLSKVVMGPDPAQGQVFQMTVPGGYWKASLLASGDFGLISEAVCPGFDYRDRELATPATVRGAFPQHWGALAPYVLDHARDTVCGQTASGQMDSREAG
ncbi:cupin domain-containing protein [Vampirovibrio chlorellavorus]|uniref:cupin domain-containing protein n=1 Tax=Vampirovibrio chlorellavorus TaxID=758823 RepID=UPI0026ECC0FF|nr:cupin domain-containing protein [Vampirovibrio chlorellavorus]